VEDAAGRAAGDVEAFDDGVRAGDVQRVHAAVEDRALATDAHAAEGDLLGGGAVGLQQERAVAGASCDLDDVTGLERRELRETGDLAGSDLVGGRVGLAGDDGAEGRNHNRNSEKTILHQLTTMLEDLPGRFRLGRFPQAHSWRIR
jgi:hypothetical protein